MRVLILLCCFLAAGLWLASPTVGADANPASSSAEALDTSLQAVEWYTNESVRKALQAENLGDIANARLFGDKAIESDLKAQGLRNETAAAWLAANKPDSAQATWRRAAGMAKERAALLGNRIQPFKRQWQAGADAADHDVTVHDVTTAREHEILYLQAVLLTAQQWVLVAQFSGSAADPDQKQAAIEELKNLLPPLQQGNRLAVLQADPRLAGSAVKVQEWQRLVSPL